MVESDKCMVVSQLLGARARAAPPTVYAYAVLRGVQYVHWVMHKCIMVKVGGNEIHVKYVKVGGNNSFSETGGKCTETAKIGGSSKFVVDD